jgi:hypothetical protein
MKWEDVPSLIIQTLTFSPKVLTFSTSSFLPTLLTRPCNRCLSVLFLDKCTGASVRVISFGSKWTVRSGTKNDWADVRMVFRAWLERDGLIEFRIAVNIVKVGMSLISMSKIERQIGRCWPERLAAKLSLLVTGVKTTIATSSSPGYRIASATITLTLICFVSTTARP